MIPTQKELRKLVLDATDLIPGLLEGGEVTIKYRRPNDTIGRYRVRLNRKAEKLEIYDPENEVWRPLGGTIDPDLLADA